MIKVPKSIIEEATNIYILANTPKSLFRGLLKSALVERLKHNCSVNELLSYYNRVTAKGNRSPFVAAMAYSTLIALFAKAPPKDIAPDASFLQWGTDIEGFAQQSMGATTSMIITTQTPIPSFSISQAALPEQPKRSVINQNTTLIIV